MNQIEGALKCAMSRAIKEAFDLDYSEEQVIIEIPKDKSHGDYACNSAMQLTRQLHRNPRQIAQDVMAHFDLEAAGVASYEIAGPGFINFTMQSASLTGVIERVWKEQDAYGTNDSGAGIRVNLDVVFNHVYDKNTFSLENIVPNYYFLMNDQGDFSNGSWCGNDIDTSRRMSARYFVDTCVWMTRFYHIDGLRFDLMGILDIATINEIYLRCRAINPDFMVYGEGWNMPSFMPEEQRASMQNNGRMPFVAHFSDRFRDVVKGSTSAYEIAAKGYCTGNTELIDVVKNCAPAASISAQEGCSSIRAMSSIMWNVMTITHPGTRCGNAAAARNDGSAAADKK